MSQYNPIIAAYAAHEPAEAAIRQIASGGLDMKHVSIVGKGYRSEEQVAGYYGTGERIKFWGSRGAYWGGCGVFCSAA